MAKKSLLERNSKRQKYSSNDQVKNLRNELKKKIKDPSLSIKEKIKIMHQLDNKSIDASMVRVCNRCSITGRGRGVYRMFKVSRIIMKQYPNMIPGFKKASW